MLLAALTQPREHPGDDYLCGVHLRSLAATTPLAAPRRRQTAEDCHSRNNGGQPAAAELLRAVSEHLVSRLSQGTLARSAPLTGNASIGQALADTLDELISSRRIEPQLAMRIMQQFDQSVASQLQSSVKSRITFKVGRDFIPMKRVEDIEAEHVYQGRLDTYRFCDEVWTFIVKDVTFKMADQSQEKSDRVKIVACLTKEKAQT